MGSLGFSVDFSPFTASLKAFAAATDIGQTVSALAVGHEVLRLSQFEVPHDVGTLQNSGAVDIIDNEVYVGYHAPQAARLHEHPEYRYQKGRKGKYLEDPIRRNAAALGLIMSETLKGELNGK